MYTYLPTVLNFLSTFLLKLFLQYLSLCISLSYSSFLSLSSSSRSLSYSNRTKSPPLIKKKFFNRPKYCNFSFMNIDSSSPQKDSISSSPYCFLSPSLPLPLPSSIQFLRKLFKMFSKYIPSSPPLLASMLSGWEIDYQSMSVKVIKKAQNLFH